MPFRRWKIRTKPWMFPFLRWLLGVGILIFVISSINWKQLGYLLGNVDWWLVLPIVGAMSATNIFAAWAWQFLLVNLSSNRLDFLDAIEFYYIAQAIGNVTPLNIGSDLYRIQAITSRQGKLTESITAVIIHRFTSVQAIALLGYVATYVVPLPTITARSIAFITGTLFLGTLVALPIANLRDGWLFRKVGIRTIEANRLRKITFTAFCLSFIFHSSGTLLGSLLTRFLDVKVPFLTAWAALILARLTILLPFTVNGLGIMEGALAFLFAEIGTNFEAGLALSLLMRLSHLITMILGIIFLWRQKRSNNNSSLF